MIVDIEEVVKVIEEADVFALGFRLFAERLIVDTRMSEQQGSMIAVVEPTDSVAARFHWLGRVRPSFGLPERFMFVPWPHSFQFLEESGVLGHIRDRLVRTQPDMAEACDQAFDRLRRLEHRGTIEAIQGEELYRTLWPSHS